MCRLYGFHGNELTKVECSLVHAQNALLKQSIEDERGREHADGWGIACYADRVMPELVRHKTAAFGDTAFSHQAETIYAKTVVAHVRLATVGTAGPTNSHPFIYDNWTFAHNGTITGFGQLAPELETETERFQDARLGGTDSEQLFLWLLAQFQGQGGDLRSPEPELLFQSLASSVRELDRRCRAAAPDDEPRLTFVVTNGDLLFASCWNNPLHILERVGVHDCEICGIPHIRHEENATYRAAVVASEPITDEDWQNVANKTFVRVTPEFRIENFTPKGEVAR